MNTTIIFTVAALTMIAFIGGFARGWIERERRL
jgi:hypothetical protein